MLLEKSAGPQVRLLHGISSATVAGKDRRERCLLWYCSVAHMNHSLQGRRRRMHFQVAGCDASSYTLVVTCSTRCGTLATAWAQSTNATVAVQSQLTPRQPSSQGSDDAFQVVSRPSSCAILASALQAVCWRSLCLEPHLMCKGAHLKGIFQIGTCCCMTG